MRQLVTRGHRIKAVFTAGRNGSIPIPMPPAVESWPIRGYWNRNLGQTVLSIVSHWPRYFGLESTFKRLQLGVSWRSVRWHNNRFHRRVIRNLTTIRDDFDLAYVHADPHLASAIADILPTCLRLPGPINAEQWRWLRNVQLVVANGDALQNIRKTFAGKKDIFELPIGLDCEHFSPEGGDFRTKLGWQQDEVILGYAGRFTVLKGVILLAQAFAELASIYPSLRLLLVGEGDELAAIKKIVRQCGIMSRIHFAGVQSYNYMPSWYRSMDLLVMPSLYENFSNSILEAMGCGLPIVASRVGGNQLSVSESRSGWLFEVGDLHSLIQSLKVALSKRYDWFQMGQFNHSLVEKNYSWGRTGEIFEAITVPLINNNNTKGIA